MSMVKKHIFYLCMDLCSMTGTCLYYVHCYFQYSALLDYKMKYKRVSPNVTAEIKIIHQIHRIVSKLLLNHFLGVFKANIHKNTKKSNNWGRLDGYTNKLVFQGKLQSSSKKITVLRISFIFFKFVNLPKELSVLVIGVEACK